jgi:uncharacterized protein
MSVADHQPESVQAVQIRDYLPAFFLVFVIFFLPVQPDAGILNSLAVVFVSIVLEALPFMLVGAFAGGLIEVFMSRERMTSFLPVKGWAAVLIMAAAGIVFPVCECAVVPVVRRLIGKGLPLAAAVAYLLGGPIVNPIVAGSTALAYAFDWRMVALRLALGYGIAVSIGLVIGFLFKKDNGLTANIAPDQNAYSACSCSHLHLAHPSALSNDMTQLPAFKHCSDGNASAFCNCSAIQKSRVDGWVDKLGAALRHGADDFMAVGHYLVIGAFIAALAQTYVERSVFLSVAGVPALSIILMMALAVALNLCSEADAFIAASFRWLTPWSAQLAFMLTGPMFDLKLLLMYQLVFTRRAILALSALILLEVFLVSVCLELITLVMR